MSAVCAPLREFSLTSFESQVIAEALPSRAFLRTVQEKEEFRTVEDPVIYSYLKNISDKILDKARQVEGLDLPSIEIVITDANSYAAAAIRRKNPAILVDVNLLKLCKTEDELAFVIAHEVSHFVYRWKNFSSSVRNHTQCTVVEEEFADRNGQQLALLLGYSRDGGASLMERMIEQRGKSSTFGRLAQIIDVHLDFHTRWSNLKKDYLGAERLITGNTSLGNENHKETPLSVEIKERAEKLKHISFVADAVEKAKYKKLDLSGKLEFLRDLYPHIINDARRQDFDHLVQDIDWRDRDKSEKSTVTQEFADSFIDGICAALPNIRSHGIWNINETNALIYQVLLKELKIPYQSDSSKLAPLGKFRQLETLVKEVSAASDMHTARAAAGQFIGKSKKLEKEFAEAFSYRGRAEMTLPSVFVDGTLSGGKRMFEWIEADQSRTLFKFFFQTELTPYHHDQYLDHISVSTLEHAATSKKKGSVFKHSGLLSYIEKRKKFAACTLPALHPKLPEELDSWLDKYSRFFSSSIVYNSDPLSIFDPLYGMDSKQKAAVHETTWRTFADAVLTYVSSLQPQEAKEFVTEKILEHVSYISKLLHSNNHPASDLLHALSEKDILSVEQRQNFLHDLSHIGEHMWENVRWLIEDILKLNVPKTFAEIKDFSLLFSHRSKYTPLFCCLIAHVARQSSEQDSSFLPALRGELLPCLTLLEANKPQDISTELVHAVRSLLFGQYLESGLEDDLAVDEKDAFDLIEGYKFLNSQKEFPDDISLRVWAEKIIKTFEQTESSEEKAALCAQLLHTNGDSAKIGDLRLRTAAIKNLSNALAQILGPDTGEESYLEKLNTHLIRFNVVRMYMGGHVYHEILACLADDIKAQPALAYAMEEACKITPEDIVKLSLPAKALEWVTSEIADNETRVKHLVEFLSFSATTKSIDKFIERIHSWSRWSYELDKLALMVGNYDVQRAGSNIERWTKGDMARLKRQFLGNLHAHFWAMPFEIRTVVVKKLLLDPSRSLKDEEKTFSFASKLVLDTLFPKNRYQQDSAEAREQQWARVFVDTFLKVSHESERGFLLSALLSASQISSNRKDAPPVGAVLREILIALGPAYKKLGQAIHSSPNVPERFKEHLIDLKGKVDLPTRWNLFHLFDETVPEEERQHVQWFGDIVGAASFNIVLEALMDDGEKDAYALLRRYSLAQGLKGLSTLENVTTSLAEDHAEVNKYRGDALSILDAARLLTIVETDSQLAATQSAIQFGQYHGYQVSFKDGTTISFKPVQLKAYGEGWRRMEFAPGVWFDALPATSINEKEHRKKFAAAILLMEAVNILRGKQFDYDRHERQYLHEEDDVYPVDFGGLSIDPPSEQEKLQLGEYLGRVIVQLSSETEETRSLAAVLGQKTEGEYLQRIRRALLSLSFTFKELLPSEIREVLGTAFKAPEVDTTIKRGVLLGVQKDGGIKAMGQLAKNSLKRSDSPLQITLTKFE